jgi:CRP/FNR family cyclic AMP-dependent transcriptional regulator
MQESIEAPINSLQRREKQTILARSLIGRSLGFKDCHPETLDALMSQSVLRWLAKGETLAKHGDEFDCLCLVVEGSIEVSILRHDGHRHLIHFLQPGDTVGFINMIDRQGQVNDLVSRFSDTAVLLVSGDEIRRLRTSNPDLRAAFEIQMAFRSRLLYERLAADASLTLEARLAKLLLTLATLYGLDRPEGILLDVRISQADLADWLGVSRQRINLAAQLMKSEGLLSMSYSSIIVTNLPGLKARAVS